MNRMEGMEDMCNALSSMSQKFGIEFILVGVVYDEKAERLDIAVGSNVTSRKIRNEAVEMAGKSLKREPESIQRVH